ncbi:uncharacterized protein EDB91DRAFT_1239083 [Suillus paluster]|uniref:uncharacterized protein n=1 Tax=Suillus paluster TaxID=48578 RepID=UPI001B87925F|nr:uncharacterized protein EDB91DRAFT_1239083 [Suillus paluster]KAG1730535.1 hypothetical protein EDB91DRAFT_1239083 [Suillus paluster]
MEVDDKYDSNNDADDSDGREGDTYVSLDDEENAYQAFLPQEDAVEEDGDENSEDSDEEQDLDEGADIVNDPAFNAGNGFDEDEDHLPQDDEEDLFEHSAIRNAYVCASHDVSHIILDGVACALWYAHNHAPHIEYEGLDDMRRLGVNLDSIITYLFVRDPLTLYDEDLWEQCHEEDCEGILYMTKLLTSGKLKRKPTKVLPYVAPHWAIQHWLLHPGKYQELQQWRQDGDKPRQVPATHVGGDNAFADPSNPMHDMHDAWGWHAIQAGLQCVYHNNGQLRVLDDDIHNLQQRFVSLPCGLVWQINLDWFQTVKQGNHSTGALYMTCCNNPRGVHHLTKETFLIMVLPGPNEPNLEQLNKIMTKFVSNMIELYGGREFQIYGHEDKHPIHSALNSEVSNLPASHKIEGLASFSSKLFMCPQCETPSYYLADPRGFNSTDFRLSDAWCYVKYAFRSRSLDNDDQKEIFECRGVHWSVFNLIPGWLTAVNSVVEFMHCVYLCMVRHVTKVIILQSGMLNPIPREDCVLFVGLFVAWEIDGIIPNINTPKSRTNTKHAAAHVKNEKVMRQHRLEILLSETEAHPTDEQLDENDALTMDCSIRHHHATILEFSAAIRILSSHSISPDEVERGCAALSRACQNWACMGCHLMPYFHFTQHLRRQFLQFGPCYATWVFPYEQNNGFLSRTNHNNHRGGELECTMMRKWWKWVLDHDLLNTFRRLPEPDENDRDSIKLLESCLKGGTHPHHGTLQEYLASFGGQECTLQTLNPMLYGLVLQFLQDEWGELGFVIHADVVLADHGTCFMGYVKSYSHVFVEALHYGAATQPCGKSARYAYFNGQVAVKIQWIFKIDMEYEDQGEISKTVAVVCPFVTDDNMPAFPWDLRAIDLGVQVWYGNALGDMEVIEIELVLGQLILIPITVSGVEYWVTVAHNHVHLV